MRSTLKQFVLSLQLVRCARQKILEIKNEVKISRSQHLKVKYSSKSQYRKSFIPFIFEETYTSIQQGMQTQHKTFPATLMSNSIKSDLRVMKLRGTVPSYCYPTMMVLLLTFSEAGEEDISLVSIASEQVGGTIEAVFPNDTYEKINNPTAFNRNTKWKATYVSSLISYQRMYDACTFRFFDHSHCLSKIAKGNVEALPTVSKKKINSFLKSTTLNSSQKNAIQSFLKAPEGEVVLLQGPPGTGKSTTIVQLLNELIKDKKKVIVCASSNKAVQILASRFLKDFPDYPVILTGMESSVPEHLRPIYLKTWFKECSLLLFDCWIERDSFDTRNECLLRVDKTEENVREAVKAISVFFPDFHSNNSVKEYFRKLQEMRRKIKSFDFSRKDPFEFFLPNFKKYENAKSNLKTFWNNEIGKNIETKLLKNSAVIFSTLSVTGRPSMRKLFREENLDVLIVDEAGQSVEAETLIPFWFRPEKVLLVGDTKQLPATVISTQAKRLKFGRSMIERLEQNGSPFLRLTTQYRMHPQICSWLSNQYYEGSLVSHKSVSSHADTGLTQALAFYDVSSGKERIVGKSRCNDEERYYVIECIRKLRETDKDSRIGVITFYSAQVAAIQEDLDKEKTWDTKVSVDTVDGFQGAECEIIILSFVCANGKEIGFLSDARRLNVAITRAKNTLILLGHARTLETVNSDVKTMIDDLRFRRKFFQKKTLDKFLIRQSVKQNMGISRKRKVLV